MNAPMKNDSDNNIDKQIAYLPADLPFSVEQKQWMGGFLAGLKTRLINNPSAETKGAQKPIMILYGTQTGNAEGVAEDAAAVARENGLAANVIDMDDIELEDLPNIERLLVVTSTYGEGEMPDNAQSLWDEISADDAPRLENTFFSVLALGDTSYDDFCLAGKEWDQRLEALGAQRIAERIDCDVDFDAPAEEWINNAVPAIAEKGSDATAAAPAAGGSKKPKSKYNRKNPLEAKLITKRTLNQEGSSKEVVHYEFSLAGSGETYQAGDALNIVALNRPDYVEEVLQLLNASAEDSVKWNDDNYKLGDLLREQLEIRTPSKELLSLLGSRNGDEELNRLLENNDTEAMYDFLWGKDSVDLLKAYPSNLTAEEFCSVCKGLAPRAYSISSSINKHAEEVHLTISSVRYNREDRNHNGVCSTFLADIAEVGDTVKCYFSPNKNFAVPEDDNLPIIMVGPGTGIAPFRAFLEERDARNAKGENWLFFGDRNSKTDFLYQEEIEAMQESGVLTKLDLAFSRDQEDKIYVQDRMMQNGKELFNWLERGGYFYVCGDALYMAKDVDKALHKLIAKHGELDEAGAEEYVTKLKKQKRYVRDVY